MKLTFLIHCKLKRAETTPNLILALEGYNCFGPMQKLFWLSKSKTTSTCPFSSMKKPI